METKLSKDEFYQNYRNYIITRREELNLKQADVAKATGLTQKTVSLIESGKKRLSLWELYVICEYFRQESGEDYNELEKQFSSVLEDSRTKESLSAKELIVEMLQQMLTLLEERDEP